MVESVYSAVRTDSLYKADYASSLKGYTLPLLPDNGGRAPKHVVDSTVLLLLLLLLLLHILHVQIIGFTIGNAFAVQHNTLE